MRQMILAIVLSALAVSPVLARDVSKSMSSPTGEAKANVRAVYICDKSAMTRRAFAREFGSAEFVSADVATSGQAWPAPRCISAREARRLRQMASSR